VIARREQDGIRIVALDRPERHNALAPDFANALVDALRDAGTSGRPIVLTGTGRTFCPGADLHWLGTFSDPSMGVAELVAAHHLAVTTLLEMPVPVICAINGAVAGGGLGLALATDHRIASERASFTAAYFRVGLTPDGGSSAFLQLTIGRQRTLEMLLTNRRVEAHEALAWALVNTVVPHDEVVERAIAFARGLEYVPHYALRETRKLLDTVNIRNQLQLESVSIRTASRGQFFRDALHEFLEAHPSPL
jgi:2-(1,2-epoxy-1,2-dihydrophenyl)acetyl-CoA isomerase